MPDPSRVALERALALAREQVVLLEAALGDASPALYRADRLVPVKVMAKQLGRSPEAVRRLCREHGLGPEIGGTYYLDQDRFAAYINRTLTP